MNLEQFDAWRDEQIAGMILTLVVLDGHTIEQATEFAHGVNEGDGWSFERDGSMGHTIRHENLRTDNLNGCVERAKVLLAAFQAQP